MTSQKILGYGYDCLQIVLNSGSMLSNATRQCDACLLSSRPQTSLSEKAMKTSRLRQQILDLYTDIVMLTAGRQYQA